MFLSYFRQPEVKKGILINLGILQRNLVSGITLLFVFSIKCPTNCMNFCINITFILVSGYHPTPLLDPEESTCNVMVDHLQSHVTPWRQCTSHVKVRGTLSRMDVRKPQTLSSKFSGGSTLVSTISGNHSIISIKVYIS